jgi:acetyl-CoA synthetase
LLICVYLIVLAERDMPQTKWITPGSLQRSMPGFTCVPFNAATQEETKEGVLSIDIARSPLYWSLGYLNNPVKTNENLSRSKRFHMTGDLVKMDNETGRFSFISRNDDVIKSSGYRIGPFEIESCIMKHERVAETAVVGVPDENCGEVRL